MTGPSRRTHVLVVRNLQATVDGKEILRGVDLEVRSGEVHAVMGPNGSGKSSLSHVLMGRPGYEITSGQVTLDGQDILAMPTWRRAQAGLFLGMQYPIEVPGVSLEAVLKESVAAGGRDPAEVDDLVASEVDRVGFDARLLKRALNVDFSGGEKKRSETLQLAVLRPLFAVLDEVDSGLDVDALGDVARRVAQAAAQDGLGVIAITHYTRLLAELRPDRVHVLSGGRIVASGGPDLADELESRGYGAWGRDEPARSTKFAPAAPTFL